jgi:hypothetical protein
LPLISFLSTVIGIESDRGNCVSGPNGFDPAWLTGGMAVDDLEVLEVLERAGMGVRAGVDVVLGVNADVVFCTVCCTGCTCCTPDCTGLVAGVVTGTVGIDGVPVGTVAAPTGVMPATEPAASTSPEVKTQTAARR